MSTRKNKQLEDLKFNEQLLVRMVHLLNEDGLDTSKSKLMSLRINSDLDEHLEEFIHYMKELFPELDNHHTFNKSKILQAMLVILFDLFAHNGKYIPKEALYERDSLKYSLARRGDLLKAIGLKATDNRPLPKKLPKYKLAAIERNNK